MGESHKSSTVRIIGRDKRQAGTGMLITPGHLLTCTHVVALAQGDPRGMRFAMDEPVQFDLPLLPAQAGTGEQWAFPLLCQPVLKAPQVGDLADIAILAVRDADRLPVDARPVPLVNLAQPYGREAMAFGFNRWVGDTVRLSLLGLNTTGAIQIEQRPGYPEVLPGFSGAAVWDPQGWTAVGMLVRRDHDDQLGPRTVYMIAAAQLIAVLEEAGVDYPFLAERLSPEEPTQVRRPWPEMDDSVQEALRKVLTGIPQLRLRKDREHLVNRALGTHPIVDRITSWEEIQANFADELVRLLADGGYQPLPDGRHGVAGVLYVIAQLGYADHPRIREDYAALTEIFGNQGPPLLRSAPRRDSPVELARAKWSKYPTE